MTRGGASIVPGSVNHVISRFVARDWFIESSTERDTYLSLFAHAIAQTDWRWFAFALMSSHIHLGLVAGEVPLVDWMRPMHTAFANEINLRRSRIGAVFVRGPNVIAVKPEETARLLNYIHANPVRAGVVSNPRECDWTSHRGYAGISNVRGLDIETGLSLVGTDAATLVEWIESTTLDGDELDRIREIRRRGRPQKERPTTEPSPTCDTFVIPKRDRAYRLRRDQAGNVR